MDRVYPPHGIYFINPATLFTILMIYKITIIEKIGGNSKKYLDNEKKYYYI